MFWTDLSQYLQTMAILPRCMTTSSILHAELVIIVKYQLLVHIHLAQHRGYASTSVPHYRAGF